MRQLFLGDTDSGVGHGKSNPLLLISVLFLNGQPDGSVFGKFKCVTQQVDNNLTEPVRVSSQRNGFLRVFKFQGVVVFCREILDRLYGFIEEFIKDDIFGCDDNFPGLKF